MKLPVVLTAIAAPEPVGGISRDDPSFSRRPHVLLAADQTGQVDTVKESRDAIAQILRDENCHHLLITAGEGSDRRPAVSAPDLIMRLREVGYAGCIHARLDSITPTELKTYQKAWVGYVLTQVSGDPSFLHDVQTLTVAAPAGAACLSIVQVNP